MTNVFSQQNSISLCPASLCTPRQNLPVIPGVSSYFCILVPYNEKDICFMCQFQKVLQIFIDCLSTASSALVFGAQAWITVILNGLLWKRTEIILSFLRLHPSNAFQTLLLTMMATPFLLRDSCPQQQILWSSELNSHIPVHFSSLIHRMSKFTLAISSKLH